MRPASSVNMPNTIRRLRGALGDPREHHTAAVAVPEPLAGFVLHRAPFQHPKKLLGGRQLLDRHGNHIGVPVLHLVLVEVVIDTGTVGKMLLASGPVVDQGRSSPSTDRAAVSGPSSPRSTRLMTVSAVSPFEPRFVANCVPTT